MKRERTEKKLIFCMRVFKRYGSFLFDSQARLIHIGNQNGGIRAWKR